MTEGEANIEIMYRVGLNVITLRFLCNTQMEVTSRRLDKEDQGSVEGSRLQFSLLNPVVN